MGKALDIEHFKSLLLARKIELETLLKQTADDSNPVELDQTRMGRLSRMDALQVQAIAKEVEQRRKNELTRIETALTRILEDEYGYCVNCGEAIPVKRLELDPSITSCINCATP